MDLHYNNDFVRVPSPNIAVGIFVQCKWQHVVHVACTPRCTGGEKTNGNERANICECLFVSVCVCSCKKVCTCAWALYVCVSLCWCVRWSAVSEFGQKVNNYSAYSVIMVPVSPAAGEEGATSRLSSLVMKYRHRGALYTWIFINTGLTVMRPEQVGWDTHIRVRSIRQEAEGEMVKTSGRSSPCRNTALSRAEVAHPLVPAVHTHLTKKKKKASKNNS